MTIELVTEIDTYEHELIFDALKQLNLQEYLDNLVNAIQDIVDYDIDEALISQVYAVSKFISDF